MEYDIDKIVSGMDFHSNSFKNVGNLMLTNREISVLDRYKIDYSKCGNLKQLLFEIESVISDMEIVDEELELVSDSISERDYYQNTNK